MAREPKSRERRLGRRKRIRRSLVGTTERPRLSVFRSIKHIYAQIIDDADGHTLASASSLDVTGNKQKPKDKKIQVSEKVGSEVATRAQQQGIKKVVFDRGGYKYHGRVKVLANAARKGGLEF
jgi:large subunit ribosomal protein L18